MFSCLSIALALSVGIHAQESQDRVARKPNVLVILADDLGLGDLGCYNAASKIPTPHLDALARGGTRFTDAHSPSAVCTPTRYGLLTGRYAWRTRLKSGVLWGHDPCLIQPERSTLADALAGAGYQTGAVGKWHLGFGTENPVDFSAPLHPGPVDLGFDEFFGIPASLDIPPYVYVLGDRAIQPPTVTVGGSAHRRQKGGGFWRKGPASPDFRHAEVLPRFGFRAVEFLERSVRTDPEKPFFLYLALSAPHTPWLPTEDFEGQSEVSHYGDFVCQVDGLVGDVLAALDRLKVAGETLVVFTSDNGSHWPDADIKRFGHDANLGYRGQKADIWEGGHRVPFLVRWPGRVPPAEECADLLCLTDLYATVAALAEVPLAEAAAEDSFDQSAAFRGEVAREPARADVIHHSINGTFALRSGPWKLIQGLGSGGFTAPKTRKPEEGGPVGQLYHLGRDPYETKNLWLEEPEQVARMEARLSAQRAATRTRPD
jgi:arylsulfatase A-like enzyme